MKDTVKEQAALFSALADPTRLKLLKLLCQQHEPDALCVNVLVGLLSVSQPAISQHLRVLKSIGLVRGERRGYHVHYSVDPDALKHYQGLLSETLSLGEQGQEDPCKNCDVQKK
jgi:DNA-binding transcriptional ArsR family regulator